MQPDKKQHAKGYSLTTPLFANTTNAQYTQVFDVSFEGMGNEDATVSATDIKVHSLTVRAKGKLLLENTNLTIAAGELVITTHILHSNLGCRSGS